MNPELQKEIATWLASMRGAIEKGTSFAIEQAPLIVQEKLAYARITETGALVALVLGVATLLLCARWSYRQSEYGGDDWGFVTFICCFLAGIGLMVTVAQATDVVKVWFAPRLYIVEWLASLIGK